MLYQNDMLSTDPTKLWITVVNLVCNYCKRMFSFFTKTTEYTYINEIHVFHNNHVQMELHGKKINNY